ncbi:hypothetical protein ACQU0X_28925 [Pseudovibrio ascidiaceicola]|uniref:hypothetical protein n=1 Tax=Pseudovibrio ascidiaceicola TaxID=285279 RepID=UPI003D35F242
MGVLTLPLKAIYFDQIKSGEKLEEYRLVTPHWEKRLENRSYESIILTSGYPKKGDTSRRIKSPWRGVRRTFIQHEHFGPDPVEVFAIKVNESDVEPLSDAEQVKLFNLLLALKEPVTFRCEYRNWRGEVSDRCLTPQEVWYGSTEWHPEAGLMLKAIDHDKGQVRDFCIADFNLRTLRPAKATQP